MIEFFCQLYSTFVHFLYKLPRQVSFCQDKVSFWPEYHLQPLFFTQQSQTPFWDMYINETPPTPTQMVPKHPISWPEVESGQKEPLSVQSGP